jgi:hypothetical protein
MDDRSRIALFRTAREEWSETLYGLSLEEFCLPKPYGEKIKRQTTHVDAYVEALRDAGSIPAASTRSVPQGVWGKYSPMPPG